MSIANCFCDVLRHSQNFIYSHITGPICARSFLRAKRASDEMCFVVGLKEFVGHQAAAFVRASACCHPELPHSQNRMSCHYPTYRTLRC